jgi:uncharacterized membrane protein
MKLREQKKCGLLWLGIGAALFLAGLALQARDTASAGYVSGFGGGLVGVSIARLLRVRRLSRDPERAADYDASLTDERTVYISNKARSMTFFICVFVQVAASMLAILVFDQVLVGQVLCGLTCLQGLLYTLLYWHYGHRY